MHFRRCTPKDAPKRCTPRSDRARFQAPKSGSSRGNGKVGREISGSDLQDFPPLTFPSRRSCKQWGAQRPSFLPPNSPRCLPPGSPGAWCQGPGLDGGHPGEGGSPSPKGEAEEGASRRPQVQQRISIRMGSAETSRLLPRRERGKGRGSFAPPGQAWVSPPPQPWLRSAGRERPTEGLSEAQSKSIRTGLVGPS